MELRLHVVAPLFRLILIREEAVRRERDVRAHALEPCGIQNPHSKRVGDCGEEQGRRGRAHQVERYRVRPVVVGDRTRDRGECSRLVRFVHNGFERREDARGIARDQILTDDPVRSTRFAPLEEHRANRRVPNVVCRDWVSVREGHVGPQMERVGGVATGDLAVGHARHLGGEVGEPNRRAVRVVEEEGGLGVHNDLESDRLVVDLWVERKRPAR